MGRDEVLEHLLVVGYGDAVLVVPASAAELPLTTERALRDITAEVVESAAPDAAVTAMLGYAATPPRRRSSP